MICPSLKGTTIMFLVHAMAWSVCLNRMMTDQTFFTYGTPPQESYLKTWIVC